MPTEGLYSELNKFEHVSHGVFRRSNIKKNNFLLKDSIYYFHAAVNKSNKHTVDNTLAVSLNLL